MLQLERELGELNERQQKLEKAIATRDLTALEPFGERKVERPAGQPQKASPTLPALRRYRSSDGHEVLVGRTARDDDRLILRAARPNDLWLHAGDYRDRM